MKPYSQSKRRSAREPGARRPALIITADDYGMSPQFNQAMLEAAKAGLIAGISVMIKRKYIRKRELLSLGVALGLHLELKTESSYQEIIDQINRFQKRLGQWPSYLDGHQHKHLAPANLKQVMRAAKQLGLPVRSRLPEDRKLLVENGIGTPDHFISWHPSRLPILAERLRAAQAFALSELVVHPGYYDKNCSYPYNRERTDELKFLRSAQFRKLICGFKTVSYTEVTGNLSHARKTTTTR